MTTKPETPNPASVPATDRYNLVILGGGSAGLASAVGAAALGAKVALIEKGVLGGDSLHARSVPSKALVRAARAAAEVRRAPDFGLTVHGTFDVDISAVMTRLNQMRTRISAQFSIEELREKGVDVYQGEGRFADRFQIEVGGQILPFRRAVIATGSQAFVPPLEGLSDIPFLTPESIFGLTALPRRLAVIGAGPIGCELAQVFARFGCQVTIFEREDRCLNREDSEASMIIRSALESDDITFRLRTSELRFERKDNEIAVHSCSEDRWFVDFFDQVLLAAGRVPRWENLNLDAAGIQCDEQGIIVNNLLRTSNPHVFAAGDVCSQYRYTHAADALARIVIANALFMAADRVDSLLVPRCTFTDPEVAQVGLLESEAKDMRLSTLRLSFDDLDRTILDSGVSGLLKIQHDSRGTIKGATIVAANAGELISEFMLAINHGINLSALATDIHPYPTQTEIIKRAGDVYRSKLLTPSMMKMLKKFLAWRR